MKKILLVTEIIIPLHTEEGEGVNGRGKIFSLDNNLDKWENKSLQILFHEYCSNNFDLEKYQTSITNLQP